jgi:hypothetical protein
MHNSNNSNNPNNYTYKMLNYPDEMLEQIVFDFGQDEPSIWEKRVQLKYIKEFLVDKGVIPNTPQAINFVAEKFYVARLAILAVLLGRKINWEWKYLDSDEIILDDTYSIVYEGELFEIDNEKLERSITSDFNFQETYDWLFEYCKKQLILAKLSETLK